MTFWKLWTFYRFQFAAVKFLCKLLTEFLIQSFRRILFDFDASDLKLPVIYLMINEKLLLEQYFQGKHI